MKNDDNTKLHQPVEEVLSDEDLFRAGLQFVLSDGLWEGLSEVDWEPGKTKDKSQEKFNSENIVKPLFKAVKIKSCYYYLPCNNVTCKMKGQCCVVY